MFWQNQTLREEWILSLIHSSLNFKTHNVRSPYSNEFRHTVEFKKQTETSVSTKSSVYTRWGANGILYLPKTFLVENVKCECVLVVSDCNISDRLSIPMPEVMIIRPMPASDTISHEEATSVLKSV